MRTEDKTLLEAIYAPKVRKSIWEWAEENVDFGLCPNYETPMRGPYNADFMPYWKEPVECLTDPAISEVWILKCARAGASENILLNALRYTVACNPQPTLYVSGDQKSVERFMEKRIKDGLLCSYPTRQKLAAARALEHEIYFEAMDLVTTWPKSKMAFKQTGYKLVLADEISTWPSYSTDMLRKRTDTYSFSHIAGISSLDPQNRRPSSDDPILIEFEDTDKRYWNCVDPKTGNFFRFVMGSQERGYGLKWDQRAKREDGTWDMERVRATAFYLTPDGTKIRNKARLELIAKGQWIPTATAPNARRGYHINIFYMPWKSGDFGNIAVAFLEAKAKGNEHLRVFIYESLAEAWNKNIESTENELLYKRCADYLKGSLLSESEKYKNIYIGKYKVVLITVDVQKDVIWALAREWIDGGDSGLIDYRPIIPWGELEKFAMSFKMESLWIDYGYAKRAGEVFEYCIHAKSGGYPTKGFPKGFASSGLQYLPKIIDPYEGRMANSKTQMKVFHFDTNVFKMILLDMLRGESEQHWYLYKMIEREYVWQTASEECVDGLWRTKRGQDANHLWDCEVLQLLAATVKGIYKKSW